MEVEPDDNSAGPTEEMENFVADLMTQPEREQVASEIGVLQSIYGDNAIHLWHGPSSGVGSPDHTLEKSNGMDTIRFAVSLTLPSHEDVSIRVLVSLPPSYPAESPPQLQLLSRYIGAFGVDSSLFGSILRIFISQSGVEWSCGTVCVFDGLQDVLGRCESWYDDKLSKEKVEDVVRDDVLGHDSAPPQETTELTMGNGEGSGRAPLPMLALQSVPLPEGINLIEAEPIVDRKSVFVGRACRISHPSQVPLILNYLMSDRHIARAAHPIINAWRCQVGNILHQDNDDDGETAAGSRLAHLLSILEVNNVLVIVTRWFGGIHLGPDRFKHINHAARNALEMGGFLDEVEGSKSGAKGRKR